MMGGEKGESLAYCISKMKTYKITTAITISSGVVVIKLLVLSPLIDYLFGYQMKAIIKDNHVTPY